MGHRARHVNWAGAARVQLDRARPVGSRCGPAPELDLSLRYVI